MTDDKKKYRTDVAENEPLIALETAMHELHASPLSLAKRMRELGDNRSLSVITRSLQRMLAGETRVSGEILVIANLMVRELRQLLKQYAHLEWKPLANGVITTITDDFRITLHPKSKDRWLVNLVYLKTGYSPSWQPWQNGLDAAKHMAISCLEPARKEVEQIEKEKLVA
ncbi:hypothetical protein [Prosthecobacter sp.]|uniref:hypothetical protein n=1 Tax=Prosthecobacter sp. TaxID=1965333 RepID=UPI003784CAD5